MLSDNPHPTPGAENAASEPKTPLVTDQIEARLPEFFRPVCRQVAQAGNIDFVSAIITSVITATNWASGLEVQTPESVKIPCQMSLVLGVPSGGDMEQLSHCLFDPLARHDESDDNKRSANQAERHSSRRRDTRAPHVCNFLRNPDERALRYALIRNESNRLLVALSGATWFERLMHKQVTNDQVRFRNLLEAGASVSTRLADPRLPRWGGNHIKEFKASFVGLTVRANVERAARHEFFVIRSTFGSALKLVAETVRYPTALPAQNYEESWDNLLKRSGEARAPGINTIVPTAEAFDILGPWRRRMLEELETMAEQAMMFQVLVNLPWKLYGGLHWASGGMADPTSLALLARDLAEAAKARMAALHLRPSQEKGIAEDPHADRLLEKIRIRGPIRRRDLLRSETNQRRSTHDPVIAQLLKSGLILRESDGRFRAVEPVNVQPSSLS